MEAKQTPLIELLERVPQDARVVVEHDQFSSSSHPVGRLCHEAAAALRAALAQEQAEPVQEPVATTQQPAGDTPPSDYRRGYWDGFAIGKREGRIEAEDAALKAQEQAEPVAWLQPKTVDAHSRPDLGYETCSKDDYGAFPVYTTPPKAEPVQEPVAWAGCGECDCIFPCHDGKARCLRLPLQQAEPVAWLYEAGTDRTLHWQKPPLYGTPLYTAPPQRQPLSGLEVERLLEQVIGSLPAARNLVRAVERAHGIVTCGDTKERA